MSITNKLTYLEDTKTQIKEAIKAKGVEVSDTDTFRSYASKIGDIQTGGGSDCNVSTCWDSLGYTDVPQYMVDGIAYGAQIKDTWDASIDMIHYNSDLNLIYFPQVDVSNLVRLNSMFTGCVHLQYVPSLNITSKSVQMGYMFRSCTSLIAIKDIKNWDVSNVTTMKYMFDSCSSLTSLDLSGWDTSNVTDISSMFGYCGKLTSLDLSGWNTLNVTNTSLMFEDCISLTEIIGIEDFNTSNVTTMQKMFSGCKSLTSLDLSGWNTSKLLNINYIIEDCTSLTYLNITGWDTSKVTDMTYLLAAKVLEKVDGIFDLTSCAYTNNYYYFTGFGKLNELRKVTFKNLGYQSGKTGADFSYLLNWGVDSDTITDARQSLIDSLVTYTFDRTTAGYSTHTITLSANTKAVLTQTEIAQITAKGYTIA